MLFKMKDVEILQRLNYLRVPFIREKIAQYIQKENKDISVLDIGCGYGIVSECLANLDFNVVGIDADEEKIEYAKEHTRKVYYTKMDILQFSSEDVFDCIILSEVIEHFEDYKTVLEHMAPLLKNAKVIIISTINKTILSYLGGIITAEYLLRLVPPGTHKWSKFIQPGDLAHAFEQYGFKMDEIKGMFFSLLHGRWRWSNSLQMNYICAFVTESKN